jgi:hydroxyethylthiazole kinase
MEKIDVYKYIEKVKRKKPLVQCITNYVTVNDCANIVLALGASPSMAYHEKACEDTARASQALDCNMGFVGGKDAMIKSGKIHNQRKRPVVLDPVAAGSNKFYYDSCIELLRNVDLTLIRGNSSEIRALYHGEKFGSGVDASLSDQITEENLKKESGRAMELADKYKTTIAISGPIDLVVSNKRALAIINGSKTMSRITGSGCMLTALSAAFLAGLDTLDPDQVFEAAASASILMSVAGELAEEKRLRERSGNSSFRNYLIDAIYSISEKEFGLDLEVEKRANIEIIY